MKWAFNQVLKAIEFINDDTKRHELDYYGTKIELTINGKNKPNAEYFIERYKMDILVENKVTA